MTRSRPQVRHRQPAGVSHGFGLKLLEDVMHGVTESAVRHFPGPGDGHYVDSPDSTKGAVVPGGCHDVQKENVIDVPGGGSPDRVCQGPESYPVQPGLIRLARKGERIASSGGFGPGIPGISQHSRQHTGGLGPGGSLVVQDIHRKDQDPSEGHFLEHGLFPGLHPADLIPGRGSGMEEDGLEEGAPKPASPQKGHHEKKETPGPEPPEMPGPGGGAISSHTTPGLATLTLSWKIQFRRNRMARRTRVPDMTV